MVVNLLSNTDVISRTISLSDNQLVTQMSKFVDIFTYPILFIFALWLFFYKFKGDKQKRNAILLSSILLIVAVHATKTLLYQQRPCWQDTASKIECPLDSTFPSGHASVAALLVLPLIQSALFIPYLIFTLFVAFSRVYLGVHTVLDVSAGFVFGTAAYLITSRFLTSNSFKKNNGELIRQATHIFSGVVSLGLLLLIYYSTTDWRALAALTFAFLVILLLFIIYLMKYSIRIPFVSNHLKVISFRDSFIGEAAIWYLLGIILLVTFLNNFQQIIASLLILTLGDSVSTVFASKLKSKTIFKNKTLVSFAAFILFSLPAFFFVGAAAIPLVIICALAESVYLKIDDNFLIPVVCVLYFLLL